jgi:hypothetical protein
MEDSLTLNDQIEHAKALLSNQKRMEELIARRLQLTEELETVEADLAELLGPAETQSTRKCSNCGQPGHTSRKCPKPKE